MASLKHRAQFYQTLGTLYDAGVPIVQALGNPCPGAFGRVARNVAEELERSGGSLAESLADHSRLFSRFECALLRVGERTGSLAVVFPALRDWCEFRIRMRSILVSGLLYPAFLYHAAAFLLPFIGMLIQQRSIGSTVLRLAVWNLLPYVILVVGWGLPRIFGGSRVSAALALRLPLFGRLIEKSELAQFFRAYQLGIEAGVHTPEAVVLAADGCRNAVIREAMRAAGRESEQKRCPPGQVLANHLPGGVKRHAMVVQLLNTGEATGRSDEMARRIADTYSEQTANAYRRIADMVPKIVYIIIVLAIAWQIIRSYQAIFNAVYQDLGDL